MKRSVTAVFLVLALILLAGLAWAQMGPGMMGRGPQGGGPYGPGYGPGAMMGPGGYGGYGPGMMMGPGMMGPGMMMGGYGGYGPGMMGMMMGHMMGGGMGMMGGGMGMGYMLPYLGLTPEQWAKVRALAAERLEKMTDLAGKMSKLRLELWGEGWQGNVDPAKVKKTFARMAEVHAEMFILGNQYLQKVKGILTKEQLDRLEKRRF